MVKAAMPGVAQEMKLLAAAAVAVAVEARGDLEAWAGGGKEEEEEAIGRVVAACLSVAVALLRVAWAFTASTIPGSGVHGATAHGLTGEGEEKRTCN